MQRPDRRTLLGVGLIMSSLAGLALAIVFIVSGVVGDNVDLPSDGSLSNILDNDSGQGTVLDGPPLSDSATIPQGSLPIRVSVPNVYIDAPVVTLGVGADDYPEVPGRGDQVAWYNFSATPGLGNNAVFSGHVDWQTADGRPIPGAFYRLRELRIGDEIDVALEDGTVLKYRVTGNVATKWDDTNITRSMSPTIRDVVTLITCGGTWMIDHSKPEGGNYSHRIVVRAELVTPAAAAALPPASE
ncbi:MAG: class F sortase [Dehalococcoidia bacterium]